MELSATRVAIISAASQELSSIFMKSKGSLPTVSVV
jgi:hypothetical protein